MTAFADRSKGFVYFVEAPELGLIKIGYSLNPERRLRDLRWILPCEVRLLGSRRGSIWVEQELQAEVAEHRVRSEWFRDCPAVRALLRREIASEVAA